jgi:predicted porin
MKKSLLALAALGAFAGSATAQSSVTLFGVVDVSLAYINNTDSKYMMISSGNSSSRLGFRGTEDLGGGLKAGFWLEAPLQIENGASTNNLGDATGGFRFVRRSTVSLMHDRWGEVRLGRDYTPTFWNWTVFDPFGTNGVGAATNIALEFTGAVGGTYGTLVRANNSVGYFLPGNLGGFYGQAMVAAGEGQPGNKYVGGRIGYAQGPFNVAFAYGETQFLVNPDTNGTNWNIGGSWDFKFLKVSAFYGNLSIDAPGTVGATTVGDFDQDNWYLGLSAPWGAWTFKASYGYVDRKRAFSGSGAINPSTGKPYLVSPVTGDPLTTGSSEQYAIGAVYDLSKRTALYATYSYIANGDVAFSVYSGRNAPRTAAGDNSQGIQFGVRHSF